MHEASLHEQNCFITLTYDDENLPVDESINVKDYQLFMKKLRHRFPDKKIRFFHCGEYGEKYGRPHYHAIIFGVDFSQDKIPGGQSNGIMYYNSPTLDKCWGKGYATIGDVTFESASYVARYIMKKITGDEAEEHYQHVTRYGELVQRKPEYTTMSRKPGIAKKWIQKYQDDVYPDDVLIIRTKDGQYIPSKPPRFYDSHFEMENPDQMEIIRQERVRAGYLSDRNDTARLKAKETITRQKLKQLPRNLPE